MAFKSAAEMFGDGAGFGPAVPFSTTNPPGTSAGNRGIQFGEQLTAAISNRTHYALVLNDEDLNTRLALFESGGLDAAYDNGTAGPAGGGRDVTKDNGAIQTNSAHSTVFGDAQRDPVHIRANALSDTQASSVGFDFQARRVGASGQSGNDALAGILDRRVVAKSSGLTVLTNLVAATLNPGGSAPTTVRLGAGGFRSSNLTDLVAGFDLVQVIGGTTPGLYVINAFTGTDTDAQLVNPDGSTPAFASGEAVQVTVFRVKIGSFGSFSTRPNLGAVTMVGTPESDSVLDIVPAMNQTDTLDGGAENAIRIMGRSGGGSVFTTKRFDFMGREHFSLTRTQIPDELDRNLKGGNYSRYQDHTANPGVGDIKIGGLFAQRHDFVSLQPIDLSNIGGTTVTPGVTTMTFTANSPTQGEILFTSAPGALFEELVPGVAAYVEITGTPSSGVSDGLYWILNIINSGGNKGFNVRRMDGNLPAHFPVTGNFVVGRICAASVLGRFVEFPNSDPVSGLGGDIRVNNILAATSSGLEGNTALAVFAANDASIADNALIRAFRVRDASTDKYQEVFLLASSGAAVFRGPVFSGVGGGSEGFSIGTASGEYVYSTPRARVTEVNTRDFTPNIAPDGTVDWCHNTTVWRPRVAGSFIWAPIVLPTGAVISSIEVLIDPSAARSTDGDQWGASIAKVLYDWVPAISTPTASLITLSGAVTIVLDDETSNLQVLTLTPASTLTLNDLNTAEYYIQVRGPAAPAAGDLLYGARINWIDIGPRNF